MQRLLGKAVSAMLAGGTLEMKEELSLYAIAFSIICDAIEGTLLRHESDRIFVELRSTSSFQDKERIFGDFRVEDGSWNLGKPPRPLSQDEVRMVPTLARLAREMVADLATKNLAARQYNAHGFLSSEQELRLLQKILGPERSHRLSGFQMPYITARNYSRILAIRDQEWPHFEDFRKAFGNYSNEVSQVPEMSADIFNDVVLPEIISIEKVVRSHKASSTAKIVDGVGIGLLSITSAVLTSGFSALVAGAAAALRGGHFAKSTLPALRERVQEPQGIRESSFCYAWRLRTIDLD